MLSYFLPTADLAVMQHCRGRWEELRNRAWVCWPTLFGPADPSVSPHRVQTKSCMTLISAWLRVFSNAPHACSRHWRAVCVCLSASLPEVFGEGGCIQGAGGGPCGGARSGEPTKRLCAAAAEEPGCSLAAHHRRHHHDGLPALRPQRGKMQPPVPSVWFSTGKDLKSTVDL